MAAKAANETTFFRRRNSVAPIGREAADVLAERSQNQLVQNHDIPCNTSLVSTIQDTLKAQRMIPSEFGRDVELLRTKGRKTCLSFDT